MDRFNITYGEEKCEQLFNVLGEEVMDGVDCWIIEYLYRPPACRTTDDAKTVLTLIGGKLWVGKTTQEWVSLESYEEVMNTKITTLVTNPYRIRQPLSVGKSWLYESTSRMIPELSPPATNTYRAEVVSQEDISVPAGTFTSYKVGFTLMAVDGVEVDKPVLETILWLAADTCFEIKRETYAVWNQTEIVELAAAEGYKARVQPA